MRRKAQIQMNETLFVVFFILIIIILGFVVYSKFQETKIKEQQKAFKNLRVIEMAHRLSSWPELECSVGGVTEFVCLDIPKLMIFRNFIETSKQEDTYAFNYYFNLLGDSKIIVTEVYPRQGFPPSNRFWELYDNPGRTKVIDRIPVPVNLYDPFTKTYSFGIMELFVYD